MFSKLKFSAEILFRAFFLLIDTHFCSFYDDVCFHFDCLFYEKAPHFPAQPISGTHYCIHFIIDIALHKSTERKKMLI